MSLLILFFHPPSTTEIYTLSLHDALPIFITRSDFIDEDIVHNESVKVVRNKTQSNRQLQEQDLHERAAEKLGTLGVDPKVLQTAISVSVYAAQETATAQNGDEYCSALQDRKSVVE